MKVAVLLTGSERSLPRTVEFLRRNLIDPNQAIVFLACETDAPERIRSHFEGCTVGGADLRPTFRTPEFEGLKQWMQTESRPALRDHVFHRSGEHPSYVWNSGTILQYYQVWKAWLHLLEYERTHGVFDVVVRWRTDVVLTRPLDLSRLTTEGDEDTCRSMGDPYMYSHRTSRVYGDYYEHPRGHPWSSAVVWTMGCEQAWIAKRDVFALLAPMVFSFGQWDSGRPSAFSSEAFFHQFCIANHITHWVFLEPGHPIYGSPESPYLWSIVR